MNNLILKRTLAFMVDYLIIAAYAAILYLVVQLIYNGNVPASQNPYKGQVIGFITLTLPVFLYSYLFEKSRWRGSIGKKLLKLQIVSNSSDLRRLILRNVLKYLPWEIAHTGVHWLIYYSNNNVDIPIWIWAALIISQVIVIVYFLSVLIYKGEYSIYDKIARTRITIISYQK